MCKEHTLNGSTKVLSRSHPTLYFWLRRGGRPIRSIINFMIRSNCPKSYNEFLESYLFNLRKCLFSIFPDSHFGNYTYKKSNVQILWTWNLVFLWAVCTIHQTFVLVKTYWSLQHVFNVTFFCLPRRLKEVLKTSWRHNCKTSCKHVLKTSWRRLEDVLKTF